MINKMKKLIFLAVSSCFVTVCANAQTNEDNKPSKVVRVSEKITQKTRQINNQSNQVTNNMKESNDNIKNVANNVKTIVKIFEPIFKLHFVSKKEAQGIPTTDNPNMSVTNTTGTVMPVQTNGGMNNFPSTNTTNNPSGNTTNTTATDPNYPTSNATSNSGNNTPGTNANVSNTTSNNVSVNNQKMPSANTMINSGTFVPENAMYNADGTANLGNQHNGQYGCYLDALRGTIMFGGDAEEHPESVDLVYVAPNDGGDSYLLMTPGFCHDGAGSNAMWGSNSTDNPVKSWKDFNESQVALTTLTGSQFEKIQYNSQLVGIIKQTKDFSGWYRSLSKLDGKVFAISTVMENRTAYALMYVVKQIGTSGPKGYLQIKLKVTGFDANGDGKPDASQYQVR
jgi:hypothetical protein